MVRVEMTKWGQTLEDLRRASVSASHWRSRERFQALYLTSFRQLRLGFRRNSFGDGPGIVPEPLSWCHATTISPLNPRWPAL
jgi:hypothetical protein